MTPLALDPRAALLASEAEARLGWDLAVAAVPASAVAARVLPDGRSVKDLVAHVADWERWSTERLRARSEGRELEPTGDWHAYEHAFNERSFARWSDAPWDDVRAEAQAAYEGFRRVIEGLSEDELFGERATARLIRATGSEHYAPYVLQIRALLESQPLLTEFETPRLRLRSFRPSDGHFLYRLFNDPDVMRYIPPSPVQITLERAQRAADRRIATERANGFALWMVERKDTGEPIGQCGFALVENKGPDVEIAYEYVKPAWGHGYGTEAATACLSRGFEKLGLRRLIALCYPENVGSWRVMEKSGMRSDGTGLYYGILMKRYVAEKEWWRAPA